MDVTNLDDVRKQLDEHGFTETRVDGRRVHHTGFDSDGNELRSMHPGTNAEALLEANEGVLGPLAVETSYAGQTVRVRLFRGTRELQHWDIPEAWPLPRAARWWRQEFTPAFEDALADDLIKRDTFNHNRMVPWT